MTFLYIHTKLFNNTTCCLPPNLSTSIQQPIYHIIIHNDLNKAYDNIIQDIHKHNPDIKIHNKINALLIHKPIYYRDHKYHIIKLTINKLYNLNTNSDIVDISTKNYNINNKIKYMLLCTYINEHGNMSYYVSFHSSIKQAVNRGIAIIDNEMDYEYVLFDHGKYINDMNKYKKIWHGSYDHNKGEGCIHTIKKIKPNKIYSINEQHSICYN